MKNQKTTMNKPSFGVSNEAVAYKVLASSNIKLAVEFITAISNPPSNQRKNDFFRFCVDKFPDILSLRLTQIYTAKEPRASNEIRESAMRFLYVIIVVEKVSSKLKFAIVHQLWTRLISCLEEQEISESTLKILSKLVDCTTLKLITNRKANWHDLRLCEFILSKAETEFVKAVSVFNSLSMHLNGDDFVIPLTEKILPTILITLSGEDKCLTHWCLAFVGGFCAAVHLLKTTRLDLVKNLADKMLDSVKRGMELGFMDMTVKEVEAVVENQIWWYRTRELRFVFGLARTIDAIITEDRTTNMLQKVKMVVVKKMLATGEVIDYTDEDWIYQRP